MPKITGLFPTEYNHVCASSPHPVIVNLIDLTRRRIIFFPTTQRLATCDLDELRHLPMSSNLNRLLALLTISSFFGHLWSGESIAEHWYRIDSNSLIGLQSFIEGRVDPNPDAPTVYINFVLPVLSCSVWGLTCILCLVGLTISLGTRRLQTTYHNTKP